MVFGGGRQRRASEHRHCRNCLGQLNSSQVHHLVAIHGYRVGLVLCHRWPTNRSVADRWSAQVSVIQRSRTSRWPRSVANQDDHIPWSHRGDPMSKCIFAKKKLSETFLFFGQCAYMMLRNFIFKNKVVVFSYIKEKLI